MHRRRRNVGTNERWLSLLGGAGALFAGLRRRGPGGLALAGLGAALLYRGGSGYCPANAALGRDTTRLGEGDLLRFGAADASAVMRASVTINREADALYAYWADFTQLPTFMRHIREVSPAGEGRWLWRAELPVLGEVRWQAELTAAEPGQRLAWRSIEGSEIESEGELDLRAQPAERGTDVQVELRYRLRGALGGLAARLGRALGEEVLREDLRRFKQIMETGELSRASESPAARPPQRLQ